MKRKLFLPFLLMLVFAVSRIPGLMPDNFSAAYAIAFCAGVFFPNKLGWWVPMVVLAVTDIALDCYYQFSLGVACFTFTGLLYMLGNYAGYAVLIWLGKKFTPKSSFLSLLSGGLLGAILFYIVTNTMSWLINPSHAPEYTRNLAGWLWALIKGTSGWPDTWTFFKSTLLSGGLFTGLFAGAVKLTQTDEAPEEETQPEESEPEPAEEPHEAEA